MKAVLMPGTKQSGAEAALRPIVDRLTGQFDAAKARFKAAHERQDTAAETTAQNEMDALLLFQRDMGAFVRLYTYLSQVFDYGNTDIEKRAIFFKMLLRVLKFGRERDGIDLSQLRLTHHALRNQGRRTLILGEGENPRLDPPSETGGGSVNERQKALLAEILRQVNDLFEGNLTDGDMLTYVNGMTGKLLESEMLQQQAHNNSKEQFSNSPDLNTGLTDAAIDSGDAYSLMNRQVLESAETRERLKQILLGPGQLYEKLREAAANRPAL